jgi:coatomer subunit gamma
VDESSFATSLYKIPQFASMGSVFRSSKPQALTESELEYLVDVIKHVFPQHVVFQFNIKNTVPEQVLLNVNIDVESPDDSVWKKVCLCVPLFTTTPVDSVSSHQVVNIPAPRVNASAPAVAYVAFKRNAEAGFPASSFPCEMKFNVADCDPDSGEPDSEGYEDVFPLEAVEVPTSEFMAKVAVSNFRAAWEGLSEDGEVLESFALSFKTVPEAVTAVLDFLGMAPCDGTGVVKDGSTKHNAYLSGVFLGGIRVLARMAVVIDDTNGCVLKIAVRSEDADVSRLVADCIH